MASMIDTERFRGTAAAAHRTGGRGGGGVDDIHRRLTAVESSVDAVRTETGVIHSDVSAIKAQIPHLAIKADLQEVKTALQEVRTEVKADIAQLRGEFHAFQTRMIQWFVGTAIAVTTACFTLFKMMHL
jgi:chromosome segregation ATPase